MGDEKKSFSISEMVWELFTSVKFTVVILALWLLTSVAGTVILQNGEPSRYVEIYGPQWSNIFSSLGLFDVYHSVPYRLILLFISLGLLACSLNTLPSKMALAFQSPKSRRVQGSGKDYISRRAAVADETESWNRLKAALLKRYGKVEEFEEAGVRRLFAHKQAFAHFMVYLVHLSLILIVAGGLVGSFYGFEGVMEIPEGQTVDFLFKKSGSQYTRAPFVYAVRCDAFQFLRFKDGGVKAYISDLTVLDQGQEVMKKQITVNDPMSYGRFNFYQSSYVEQAPLKLTDPKTGQSAEARLAIGEETEIPSLNAVVQLSDFIPNSAMGMAARVTVGLEGGRTFETFLRAKAPPDDQQPLKVEFARDKPYYTTGLQVVADPGVGWVWAGCFLMMIGLYLTFYSSHRRISAALEGGRLTLNGRTERNRSGFRREIERLLKEAGVKAEPDDSNGRGTNP